MPALNDATMVIVQFESAAALDKTEEIVAVDGIDMVLVGLNDLLADWGIPGQYDHPRVREVYAADHRRLPQARQALRRGRPRDAARTWSPTSFGWARAMSRPAPTWHSCSAPAPPGPSRCGRSSSDGDAASVTAARAGRNRQKAGIGAAERALGAARLRSGTRTPARSHPDMPRTRPGHIAAPSHDMPVVHNDGRTGYRWRGHGDSLQSVAAYNSRRRVPGGTCECRHCMERC